MSNTKQYEHNAKRIDKIINELLEEERRIKQQHERIKRYRRMRKLRMIKPFITCLIFSYVVFSFVFMDLLWFINLKWDYRAAYIVFYLCMSIPFMVMDDKR